MEGVRMRKKETLRGVVEWIGNGYDYYCLEDKDKKKYLQDVLTDFIYEKVRITIEEIE